MSKYKTRSEKLLNTIKKLKAKGELSINELRTLSGSLSEARKMAELLAELNVAESVLKKNDKTKRDAEYLKYIEGWSLNQEHMTLINEYVMGQRESRKYTALHNFLEPHMGQAPHLPEDMHSKPESSREDKEKPVKADTEGPVLTEKVRADSKAAEKFVKNFVDVQDIAFRQHSEKRKMKQGS
jgi:hypothetical protein